MLTYTVRDRNDGPAFQLELRGHTVRAVEMRWTGVAWASTRAVVGEGEWDFSAQAVRAVDSRMPRGLVAVMNRVFGQRMRALDLPRQAGLFDGACCVCGSDQNTFPETAVWDGYDNIIETRGRQWMAPEAPIRWRCHVCDRLVCRRCTLTWRDSQEYYFHTYCSEACRQAAPPGFTDDDLTMAGR